MAVFVFDPGKISGVGCGVFDMSGGSVREVYHDALERRSVETWEAEGDWLDQADEIVEMYREWREGLGTQPNIYVVSEDFQLTRKTRDGSAQMLSGPWVLWPVKITAAVEYELRRETVLFSKQQASQAKTYATDQRLKAWDLWTPSSRDHRRDATRHLLLKIHKHLK